MARCMGYWAGVGILAIAAAGASRELDPEWLILQPMNEPVFNRDPAIWPSIQERIVSASRARSARAR